MNTINILGSNRHKTFTKTRKGCRGIVLRGGKLLLSRELNTDYWLIPGGGLEAGESLPECCERELLEETGFCTKAGELFLTINEYYEEYQYVSYYFLCEILGEGKQHLTDAERARGLIPAWLPLESAIEIFKAYPSYAATNEEKRGSYQREYTALSEYLNLPPRRCIHEP